MCDLNWEKIRQSSYISESLHMPYKAVLEKPRQNEAALPSNSHPCKCLVCSSHKGNIPCERIYLIYIITHVISSIVISFTFDPDLKELTPSWHNICGGTYLFSEDTKSWYHNNQIETIKNINHWMHRVVNQLPQGWCHRQLWTLWKPPSTGTII